MFDVKELQKFVLQWNIDFPIDRWWRKRHKVPFGSPVHRETSFIDMYFEWEEDRLYKDTIEKHRRLEEDPYVPGQGNFLFYREIQQEISETEFDNIDLDNI